MLWRGSCSDNVDCDKSRGFPPSLPYFKSGVEGGAHQQVHHVGLVVPQRLDSMKDVDGTLVLQHLAHDADGAKGSAAPAAVPNREFVSSTFKPPPLENLNDVP